MLVTFDTNVWARMVFPQRQINSPRHAAFVKINNAIQRGVVRGFISESFGTLESVKKTNRAEFDAQSIPKVELTRMTQGNGFTGFGVETGADHSLHPGLSEQFEKELGQALEIGMKLLPSPYVGVPKPARFLNNPDIYAPDIFATAYYNERFAHVAETIAARGVGYGRLGTLAQEFTERLDAPRPAGWSDRYLIYRIYKYACDSGLNREKSQIEKAFSESADGEVVAAHIAFGNDYLCTQDRGGSAAAPSIFDQDNRAWLKTEYGVEIVNLQELSDRL